MATAVKPRRVLVVLSNGGTSTHPLPHEGVIRIGRASDNDVCVRDAAISRHHAVLHVGPTLRIEDLGSTVGTRVRSTSRPSRSEGSETEPYLDVLVAPGRSEPLGADQIVQLGSVILAIR